MTSLVALLCTMGLALPFHLMLQRVSHPFERRAWRWLVTRTPTSRRGRLACGGVRTVLMSRLRSEMQWQLARLSLPAAIGRGVRVGLPFAAIIAATVPMWGMSWYFDTENWAAGLYNSWAETRTDDWRAAMVRAVTASERQAGRVADFSVAPPGLGEAFSFIVIGDTGEGDASQQVLRDQLLSVASREEVRFVVVSSDVVYPTGAMRDYEAKFWLPFKGVTKPVFAIPGNHDWYDALEGFNATFLTASAARAAMAARVNADLKISTTTADRIDELVAEATRLRREYDVPTGFQRAPFFDIQTDTFALLAVDTGVVKRVDDEQLVWLEQALARARGKTILAVLGHPFYASGMDLRPGHEDFQKLYDLLQAHGVSVVMAGDTHDLEHYLEPTATGGVIQHVVNGGGGAYLSFGSALAWPAEPALGNWAYLPLVRRGHRQDRRPDAVVEAARLVVDAELRRVALLRRVAVGGLRLQHRALLSELRRGARRARAPDDASLWPARPVAVVRPLCIERRTSGRGGARRSCGVVGRSAAIECTSVFWLLPLHVVGLFLATGLSIWAAVIARSRRAVPGSNSFGWLMLAVAHWCLISALHALVSETDARIALNKVQFLSVGSIGVLWLLFASGYARIAWPSRPAVRAALWLVPITTIVLAITNEAHGLHLDRRSR